MRSEIERLARELVPGRGELKFEHLSGGLESETYRVSRDGTFYAVKVGAATAQRRFEAQVLPSAAAAGLAPRLLAVDPDRRMLVLEWLAGTPMSEAAAQRAQLAIASLLRAVHELPVPPGARPMSPRTWIEHYQAALAASGSQGVGRLAPRAAEWLTRLEAEQKPPRCVCHSDLHRLNVLVREPGRQEALVLLDWEYAHVSEPFWDLAGWSANNDLDAPGRRALLGAYLNREPSAPQSARLEALCWLYDYVCLQWIGLYVTRRGRAAAAFEARAAELERRLNAPVYGTIAVATNF